MKTQETLLDRFESKLAQEQGTGCILFQGSKNSKGYGRFTLGGNKEVLAHRFAWEQVNGPIPEDMAIEHICQNPACVNVDHMRLVDKNSKKLVVTADEDITLTEESVESYPEIEANFPEIPVGNGDLPSFNITDEVPVTLKPEKASAPVIAKVESELAPEIEAKIDDTLNALEFPGLDVTPKDKGKKETEKKPRTYAIPGGEPSYCKLGHLKTVPRVYPNGIRLQCGECAKLAANRAKAKRDALKADMKPEEYSTQLNAESVTNIK